MFAMIKSTDRKRVFNHERKLCDLIKENPYLIKEKDWLGLTALHWAVKRNYIKFVEFLIHFKSKDE